MGSGSGGTQKAHPFISLAFFFNSKRCTMTQQPLVCRNEFSPYREKFTGLYCRRHHRTASRVQRFVRLLSTTSSPYTARCVQASYTYSFPMIIAYTYRPLASCTYSLSSFEPCEPSLECNRGGAEVLRHSWLELQEPRHQAILVVHVHDSRRLYGSRITSSDSSGGLISLEYMHKQGAGTGKSNGGLSGRRNSAWPRAVFPAVTPPTKALEITNISPQILTV